MPGTASQRPLTREEWAARTEIPRRRARFKRLLDRARRDVERDPRLTADELAELAAIYGRAASGGGREQEAIQDRGNGSR
jgi:hypothetical protein